MHDVEICNYKREGNLFEMNIETKKIELICKDNLMIIDTKNTNKFTMKLIRFLLKHF